MSQKLSDLSLGVIDFLGILILGAIMTFLHGELLLRPLGVSIGTLQTLAGWIPVFVVSYVLGHFLLGFSEPLNRLAAYFRSKETEAYYQAVRKRLKLPLDVPDNRMNFFYSAFSFIRIHSPEAMVELERQAAEYKLFRSLTLLFLLDIPLVAFSSSFSLPRLLSSIVIVCLSAYRFQWLLNWTYQLAFDFYLQLQKPPVKEKAA